MTIRLISAATLFSLLYSQAAGATQYVATAATFQSVMAKVIGGDSVRLVGNFGMTRLTNTNFSSLVTINAVAATFSDTLLLTDVSNVNVVGGHFGSASAAESYDKAIFVSGGDNVTFTKSVVTGYFTGQGIAFENTTNATVTGASLSKLQAGVVFAGVVGGSINNSRSIGSVSDGFDLSDSSHIDVGNNTCSGGTPLVGAHPDCVQLFSSAGAPPPSYIAVHDNRVSGESQGFDNFGSNPGSSFLSIVNNRVDGLLPQGIACYYCTNSTITGNTLNSLRGAEFGVNLNILYGTDNTVANNTFGKWDQAAAMPTVYYTLAELLAGNTAPPVGTGGTGALPEPGVWAMLIVGFGLVGLTLRTRRRDPAMRLAAV